MHKTTASLLGALLLASPAAAQTQRIEGVAVGDWVRVQTEDTPRNRPWRSITGSLERLTPDSLTIDRDSGEVLTLPFSAVEKLEVKTGERGNGLLGALAGGTVGLVLSAIVYRPVEPSGGLVFTTGITVLVGGAAGYAVGNAIKSDEWGTVGLPRD